jgi:SPP1 family predicted phage head-tail adaptor
MPGAGAGDLRQTVTFAKPDNVTDEYGNVTQGWADQFTVFANITPRLGGETIDAARLAGRQPVIIRVRQNAETRAIAPDWKATDTHSDVTYNIRAVSDPNLGDVQHGKWIDMLAEAGVSV